MLRNLILITFSTILRAEIWQGEVGKDVYIEASTEGLKSVHLECFEDKMKVKIDLEEVGFDGVIYTRGSYKMGKRPCFYDAQGFVNEDLNLEWSFDKCKTTKKGDKRTNVIIVQQDDLLIFPGDMGFELICEGQKATIGLADPDPGAKPLSKKRKRPVTGTNGFVTFYANPQVSNSNESDLPEVVLEKPSPMKDEL